MCNISPRRLATCQVLSVAVQVRDRVPIRTRSNIANSFTLTRWIGFPTQLGTRGNTFAQKFRCENSWSRAARIKIVSKFYYRLRLIYVQFLFLFLFVFFFSAAGKTRRTNETKGNESINDEAGRRFPRGRQPPWFSNAANYLAHRSLCISTVSVNTEHVMIYDRCV